MSQADPAVIDAIDDAYVRLGSKYGNVDDIDGLVKNPECIARTGPNESNILHAAAHLA